MVKNMGGGLPIQIVKSLFKIMAFSVKTKEETYYTNGLA
jgi:hypothetical protein